MKTLGKQPINSEFTPHNSFLRKAWGASCAIVLLMLLSLVACSTKGNSTERKTSVETDSLKTLFAKPEVPAMLETPQARARYYLEHYWDSFDFEHGDRYLSDSAALEQAFVDFLGIAMSLPIDEVKSTITTPAQKANGKLFLFFEHMYNHYLYEEGSPLANEDYYLPVLEFYTTSPKSDLATMERSKMLFKLVNRNRPGSYAQNFAFNIPEGEVKHLADFRGKPTLLFFFTPGCDVCKSATEYIIEETHINNYVTSGKLNLLYISADGDNDAFRKALSEIPPFATAGVNNDGTVLNAPLYDLKASPTIYLLDEFGRVILKDAPIQRINKYIEEHL